MKTNQQEINSFFEKYIQSFDGNKDADYQYYANSFLQRGVPTKDNEMWRNFHFEQVVNHPYIVQKEPQTYQPVGQFFHCDINQLESHLFAFLNGWYVHNNAPITIFPSGVVIGSLLYAKKQYADILNACSSLSKQYKHSSMFDMASAICQDGFFVYIPDYVEFKQVVQLVNVVNSNSDLFINMKNVIVVGKNASLKLMHCDDTIEGGYTLINTATEIFLDEGASVDYYKLENKDERSVLINDATIYQGANTNVKTYTNVFNGGIVHNTLNCHLYGEYANIDLNGLYLVDKKQDVTNCLSVNHHVPNCKSQQLYNGIMDDEAKANFVGHIYVAQDAQKTESAQVNHNILLTDQATIDTKPFLEIYADDVKCSHGATVGQLDDDAIFYMRSRGICQRNAKKLLMHAFAKEIVDKISIAALVDYTEDLVQKRLSGQNISCNSCTMNCQKPIHFEVKMPEL